MTEEEQRAAVVAEAMSWGGTPYAAGRALKGVAADCGRFPLAVYAAAGVVPQTVIPHYPPDWHYHREEELYLGYVKTLATQVGEKPEGTIQVTGRLPKAGDFMLWRWGKVYSHGGICTAPTMVVHSYRGVGVSLDDWTSHVELKTRPALIFSVWG